MSCFLTQCYGVSLFLVGETGSDSPVLTTHVNMQTIHGSHSSVHLYSQKERLKLYRFNSGEEIHKVPLTQQLASLISTSLLVKYQNKTQFFFSFSAGSLHHLILFLFFRMTFLGHCEKNVPKKARPYEHRMVTF